MKLRNKTHRILSLLAAIVLCTSSIPVAYADSYIGSGAGAGSGSVDPKYSWNVQKQGYRVTIVDKDGNVVNTPVDFVYSSPEYTNIQTEYYFNSKVEAFGNRTTPNPRYLISQMLATDGFDADEPLPSPMRWGATSSGNGPIGQGTLVKEWMMEGEYIPGTAPTYNPSYTWYPTTPDQSTSSTPSKPSDTTEPTQPSEPSDTTEPVETQKPTEPEETNPPETTETTPSQTPSNPSQSPSDLDTSKSPSEMTPTEYDNYVKTWAATQELVYNAEIRNDAARMSKQGYSNWGVINELHDKIELVIFPEINAMFEDVTNENIKRYAKLELKRSIRDTYFALMKEYGITLADGIGDVSDQMAVNKSNGLLEYFIAYASETTQASQATEDGYITSLLNYKVDGNFAFDIGDPTKSRVTLIQENDYRVMIEPILWFIPSTYPGFQSYGRYVYGTVTNHAQWSHYMKSNGYFDDNGIYNYWNVVRSVGSWSLYIDKDVEFTSKTIISPLKFIESLSKLKVPSVADLARNDYGYALHVYKTAGESMTQTYDESQGDTEHPAPDPQNIPLKSEDDKNSRVINIVKTYQIKKSTGETKHVTTLSRTENPATIKIMDEPTYKVREWFISEVFNNPSQDTTWETSKQQAPITNPSITEEPKALTNGTVPATIKVYKPSTTLYVLLVKTEDPEPQNPSNADLIIHESQITKAVETINPNISGWGPKTMNFKAHSLNGSCSNQTILGINPQGGFPIMGICNAPYQLDDQAFDYNVNNTKPIDTIIQPKESLLSFKPLIDKGNDASGNRTTLFEELYPVNSFNYKLVIWRGKDIPTIASYKEQNQGDISQLLNRYGNTPQGSRYTNKTQYTHNLSILLDADLLNGDYETTSITPCTHRLIKKVDHINLNTLNYDAVATVEVYWGEEHEIGNETVTTPQTNKANLAGISLTPKFSLGQMLQYTDPIKFYPYFRMTYQTTGQQDTERTNINILSQWLSEIIPNDYVETAWATKDEFNLNLKSTQWSLHAKATGQEKGWDHSNRVLPGGAIYTLDTDSNNKTYASVITWQPYLEDEVLDKVILTGSNYTYEATEEPHKQLAEQAKEALENWRIVQYVKDVSKKNGTTPDITDKKNASIALDGLKIEPNVSLKELGLSGKANTDAKYQLTSASDENLPSESDLDILKTKETITKYKVSADVEGKVYVYKDTGNGNGSSDWKVIATLNKTQGPEALTGEALALDNRTKIVTNVCKVLTRNTGNDTTAAWASSDGKWYNEAFDGICIVRRETTFTLGFSVPSIRSAALDPALCPENKGQSDLFSKAFVSQFAMNNKSDSPSMQDYSDGCIGTFKGQEVIMAGWQELFKTMPFAIPNVNVQDIH